jgi:hypothetical protein
MPGAAVASAGSVGPDIASAAAFIAGSGSVTGVALRSIVGGVRRLLERCRRFGSVRW